jgi:hypothetical protein
MNSYCPQAQTEKYLKRIDGKLPLPVITEPCKIPSVCLQKGFQFLIHFSTENMKYSQLLGCIAVLILAAICYMPWSFIADGNIIVTGMSAPGTEYGKPGLMHLVLGFVLIILFLIPKIWAKRINLFIAAINLAWSIRNYILLATCFMGECPQIKAGLISSIFLSTAIFIMTLLPDLRQIEKNKA